jgi:hypothetical protein
MFTLSFETWFGSPGAFTRIIKETLSLVLLPTRDTISPWPMLPCLLRPQGPQMKLLLASFFLK